MPDVLTAPPEAPIESSTSASPDDFMSFAEAPENVISASSATNESGQAGEADDSLLGDQVTPAPAVDETGAPSTQQTPAISFKGVTPDVVAVMKHLAANNDDYDLANPTIFKLVRQAAEKELLIRQSKPTSQEAKDYLDAFNDPEPGTPAETPQPGAVRDEDIPSYVKVAKAWTSPADFTKSLYAAFDMNDGPEKDHAVSEVMLGFVDRSFHELYFPQIQRMVENLQQAQLGPVLSQVEQARQYEERDGVVKQLEAMPGYEDVRELFEFASDGVLEVQGEQVHDTWLNRVLVENPFILNSISIKGKTPAESKRKTLAEQYRVAHGLMKAQRAKNTDPATAQRLIGAGQSLERSKRDTARTGLNSGKPGVPAGNRSGDDLLTGGTGSVSFNELFK